MEEVGSTRTVVDRMWRPPPSSILDLQHMASYATITRSESTPSSNSFCAASSRNSNHFQSTRLCGCRRCCLLTDSPHLLYAMPYSWPDALPCPRQPGHVSLELFHGTFVFLEDSGHRSVAFESYCYTLFTCSPNSH